MAKTYLIQVFNNWNPKELTIESCCDFVCTAPITCTAIAVVRGESTKRYQFGKRGIPAGSWKAERQYQGYEPLEYAYFIQISLCEWEHVA